MPMQNYSMQHLHSREAATGMTVSTPLSEQTFRPYRAHCWAHNLCLTLEQSIRQTAELTRKRMRASWSAGCQSRGCGIRHTQERQVSKDDLMNDFVSSKLEQKSAKTYAVCVKLCLYTTTLKKCAWSGYLCTQIGLTTSGRLGLVSVASHSKVHCPETVENAQVGLGVGLGVGLLSVGCGVGDGVTTPSHSLFEMPAIRIARSHFAQLCMLFCSSVNTTSWWKSPLRTAADRRHNRSPAG